MKRIRVVAALMIRDQKVFAARRTAGGNLGGYWEFPGGKLEPGENHIDALMREIQEELGVDVTVHEHFGTETYVYPFAEVELAVYRCSTESEPTHLTSHDEYRWLAIDELDSLQWAPADLFAVNQLKKAGIG